MQFMKKKVVLAAAIIGIGITGIGVNAMSGSNVQSEEKPPIVTEVERHAEVLDNHEDRITNVEKDVSAVQESTGTAPSTDRVEVREVRVPAPSESTPPTPTPSPAPTPSPSPAPQPAPAPEPDPRTIMDLSVLVTVGSNIVTCSYKLYDQRQYPGRYPVKQYSNVPCHKVGEVLPRY